MVWPVRILFWHGWLLSGSGSNVYTASLAREWRRKGNDVLLLCQDRHSERFDFVDAHGEFSADNESYGLEETGIPSHTGTCRVLVPQVGPVMPVFVLNRYGGFEVKTFSDMSDAELDVYVEMNATALDTANRSHQPDVMIVGHEVMGPYIALQTRRRAGGEYSAQLHGSGLEYAVKVQDRYRDFAIAGLTGARHVIGGSRYMISAALDATPGWEDKAAVVNLGCDVDLFRPRERDPTAPFTVGFVGGLIEQKGVHHLLAALPLVERSHLKVVIVGAGGFQRELEALWRAIKGGDRRALEGFSSSGGFVAAFAAEATGDYFRRAQSVEVEFAGHLEHDPLAEVLPYFDVLAVPSVLPEAFGLVATEAASCGVLPIVPDHSGIGEVGAAVEEHLARPGFLTFQSSQPIASLAAAINRVATLPDEERSQMEAAASELARQRWSWEVVGENLLRVAGS